MICASRPIGRSFTRCSLIAALPLLALLVAGCDDEGGGGHGTPNTACTGDLGCACNTGNTCNGDIPCTSGICRSPESLLVVLAGGDARACDLRFTLTDRRVSDVVFPSGYQGQESSRNETTAVSLIHTADTAIDGVAAVLVLEGTDAAETADVSTVTATCYDRLGNPATDVTASVQ